MLVASFARGGEAVGRLLSRNLTIGHWNSIIEHKEWQSLKHTDGIMHALKLSYDHLPRHLQQCFSYCYLFPKGYSFSEAQLIQIWIAQGFVEKSSEKLEQKGWEYLAKLVDSGFFQQVERMQFSSELYVMSDLMHDLARMISQTEYATIDGSECRELAPSIRHLKIVTDSAYCKDQNGNISRNVEFEKRLLKVKSRNKLRTLVLIRQYDFHFLKSFKDAFKELQHLRLLQITSTYADFDHFLSSLVNSTHLRYLKLENKESHVTLPQALSKCYHLQVLDIGSCGTPNIPEDINNLVSLRHLVAKKRACSYIAYLKHLLIFEYNGSTSPTWLASSLTCLQSLHLENCGKWQRLPLERLPLLIKLVLIEMGNATEVSIPSLEELVLTGLQRLKTCSCTSVRNLNSSLKVLKIRNCPALEVFPLFENCQKFEIERTSWLSHLSKLTIYNCPLLCVHNPLPPSSIVSKLLIGKVSTLPKVEGSSSGTLKIGVDPDDSCGFADQYSDQLETLDDEVLSFRNLRFLTGLTICGCRNLATISLKSLRQLVCLKSLELYNCPKLLSSNVPSELTCECMSRANHSALPSLERLHIEDCGITGEWLSLMLQHAQALQDLSLQKCKQITGLSIGEEENSQPNLMSATEAPSLGYPGRDKLLRLPLNLMSSLKKLSIIWCYDLTFYGSKVDFAGFTSLEKLVIFGCRELPWSLAHNDGNDEQSNGRWHLPLSLGELEIGYVDSLKTLQPFFPGNLARLKKLEVFGNQSLTSLQLHSCTALQELIIQSCESLNSLQGLQWLVNLRHLEVLRCPSLPPYWKSLSRQDYELRPRLERLRTDDDSVLTTSLCKHLTSLRLELKSCGSEVARLTDEQERALQLLTSLQELRFELCYNLIDLPTGLHSLPSLKRLEICSCRSIARLPEMGLPPSLEELDISNCSKELVQQCRTLASSTLKVKIRGTYVN